MGYFCYFNYLNYICYCKKKNSMDKFLNNILIVVPVCIALVLWIAFSFKCCLIFYGLYSLGMYLHITVTTLSNAFIGREINSKGDLFWKIVFVILASLCLSVSYFV